MTGLDLYAALASGGDDRLALDSVTGLNLYGCGVVPRPGELAMGSSTASTISVGAFEVVRDFHKRLLQDIDRRGEAAACSEASHAIRGDILHMLDCDVAHTPPDVILSASGTDLHLLVSLLLARRGRPLLTITLEGSETGSSVSAAAAGLHFMNSAPSGAGVQRGIPLARENPTLVLAVRDATGALRDDEDVERQIDMAIDMAIACGMDCLLVVADVTKTGLIAPGLDGVMRLKARYGDRLTFMVDACQLRISPSTIRAYLGRDMLVAITGSKFLGGPIFSGALLCPPRLGTWLRDRPLPDEAGDYFSAGDFPGGWKASAVLPARPNVGLLLRWKAALFEWGQLRVLPVEDVARVVNGFARAVDTRLRYDPAFERVATRPLERRALHMPGGAFACSDLTPTIFPFLLTQYDAAGRRIGLLNSEEMRHVHHRIALDGASERPVRLGQPVACGTRLGTNVAALRLCLGARLIVEACGRPDGLGALIGNAMHALDRAAQAARAVSDYPVSRAA